MPAGTVAAPFAAALPFDRTRAGVPSGTLRLGTTLATIPLADGFPDHGGEGQRIEIGHEVVGWNALPAIRRDGASRAVQHGATAVHISCSFAVPSSTFMRRLKSDMIPPVGGNSGRFADPGLDAMMGRAFNTSDAEQRDEVLARLHAELMDRALFLDLNPRATSRRVRDFVQARSWPQDVAPVSLG